MSRVTDHTRTEKIGGDSIDLFSVSQVVTGNRYDKKHREMFMGDNNEIESSLAEAGNVQSRRAL